MLHYTGKTGRKQDLFENRYNLGENPYSALTKPDRPATIAVLIRVIHIGELDGDIMQLDYRNTRPIYMQIVEQIRQKILAGVLAEGEQLPSVREMAMELAINPNTMQRAYRELEVQGWIYSVPGKGSYVCDIARAGAARCKELLASLDRLVAELVSLGYDREQVIRRQDMERMLRGRVGSYLHYVQLMLLLGVAVVPLCVAIGKFRGVSGIFIWWVVAGYLLCLLPSFFSLWLLLRVSRCDADIVECEHRMTRYAAFAGAYYIFQYVVVILFVAGMLLYAAGYYTAHGMWWTVAALLSLTAVACIVITHHEWGRIRDLQRRIRELREFDEA